MIDAPTQALGGRYHFLAPFRYQDDTLRWLARDERSGEKVVVALVESVRVPKLEAMKGVAHPHLASIVDVMHRFSPSAVPGGRVTTQGALVVAEYISGPTLRQELARGRMNPARAVAWCMRLAQATAELHKRGAVLGGISPFSIVTKAEGRAIPPVLTQITAPLVGATLSPERLKGGAPDPTDDVWALYACLYWALTGVAPFPGNSRDELLKDIANPPTPLAAFQVREPELEEILKRGLSGDSNQRATEIEELSKSLDAWERGLKLPPRPARGHAPRSLSGIVKGGVTPLAQSGRIVFDAASLPLDFGPELPVGAGKRPSHPNPVEPYERLNEGDRISPARPDGAMVLESQAALEASARPASSSDSTRRPSINPFAKKRSAWPALVGLALLLGAVVAFFSFNRAPAAQPTSNATPAEQQAPPPAPAKSASFARRLTPQESLNVCIKSYFPDETFAPATQVEFVCESGDHREITTKLYELSEALADRRAQAAAASAASAAAPGVADAGFQVDTVKGDAGLDRVRRPLGWYELLATAVIRKGCCPNAVPVSLPETTGWCEQLQDVVRDLADDSARTGDLAPRVKRFDKAVDCLFANRVRRPYEEYKKEPISEANRSALQQFLSHAAISDAKRRTLQR